MKEILSKLDALIKKTRPDYYEELNSPLSEIEIGALEAEFNLSLPPDLKELYLWKNGQNARCYDAFVNNSEFVPLEDALATAAELSAMIGLDFKLQNWWNKNWLPLFHNGGGSHICYDSGGTFTGLQGQILEYWKADKDRNVIAPDLKSFLAQTAALYETFSPVDFDETFAVEDIPGFPKRFYAE